jgi:hypothetical protein
MHAEEEVEANQLKEEWKELGQDKFEEKLIKKYSK